MMTISKMMTLVMTCILLLASVQCTPLKSTVCGENDVKCIEYKIRLDNFKMFFLNELGLEAPPTHSGADKSSQQEIDSYIQLIEANRDVDVFNCTKSLTDEERDCSFELANEKRDFPADEAMLEVSIREDFTRTVPFTTNLNINGNRVLVTVDKQNSHSQKIDITQIFNSWLNEEVHEKLRVSVEDESVLAIDVLDDSSEHGPYLHVRWSTRKQRSTRSANTNDDDPCSQSNSTACCKKDMVINFKDIKWDWVLHPETFNAGYCSGGCRYSQMETIRQKWIWRQNLVEKYKNGTQFNLPCVPDSTNSVRIVYNTTNGLVSTIFDDMEVTSCKCAA